MRTKRYVCNGLGAEDAPNVTYTMVWEQKTHRTLRIQWFGDTGRAKRYIYNGLGTQGAPNVTYTMVWEQKRTKRYVYNGLQSEGTKGKPWPGKVFIVF